jgi:hypothetical protein
MKIGPEVLELALILADRIMDRVVVMQDGSLVVANSSRHAQLMRTNPDFQTFGAPSPEEA